LAAMYRRVHPILDGLRRRGTTVYLVSCRTRVLASRSKQSARIAGSANAQGAIESLPMRHLVNIFHPDCDRTVRKWIGQGEHSSISAANEGERLLARGFANFGKTHSGLQEVSGHDFSRAVNAIKPTGALEPPEVFFEYKGTCDPARHPRNQEVGFGFQRPTVLPSTSANHAKVPCGISTGGTSVFPPSASTFARDAATSSVSM